MKTKLTHQELQIIADNNNVSLQAVNTESRNIKIALIVIKIFCVCYIVGMALASYFL